MVFRKVNSGINYAIALTVLLSPGVAFALGDVFSVELFVAALLVPLWLAVAGTMVAQKVPSERRSLVLANFSATVVGFVWALQASEVFVTGRQDAPVTAPLGMAIAGLPSAAVLYRAGFRGRVAIIIGIPILITAAWHIAI